MSAVEDLITALNECSTALQEVGEAYRAQLGRFVAHLDGELRMLGVLIDAGDERARVFVPPVEKLSLELRMVLTELTTEEGATS